MILNSLQLVGKTYDQFKGRQVYKNIDDYHKTFEEVIMSARQEVKTNWRRYLPIALADELKAWVRKDLLVCDSWESAKKVLEKKFGNRQMRVLATKELISLTMYHDENISDFDSRFIRMVEDSKYQVSDRIMADLYFLALPNNWQANVMTVVNSKKLKDVPWTAEDVYQATLGIFSDKTPGHEGHSHSKRKSNDTLDRSPKKRSNPDAKYHCKIHGDNYSHDDANCKYAGKSATDIARSNERSSFSSSSSSRRFLGSHNRPKPATSSSSSSFVPCDHCGRKWSHGHRCQEYKDKFADKNVLSINKDRKGKKPDRGGPSRDNENDSYECKSTENKFNPYKSLITPLILNDRKLKGKVDTGSDTTFIYVEDVIDYNKGIITLDNNGCSSINIHGSRIAPLVIIRTVGVCAQGDSPCGERNIRLLNITRTKLSLWHLRNVICGNEFRSSRILSLLCKAGITS
ncbi:hypothetical protein INT47_012465 [Mucor saturninus]|uniref:Uncharacterized protein n=1 Tax=Mucor saturninus TaxID=64648 RepID=A0A8H7QG84_9FUNG|nr:hypothetical protein INT47_012465 [Mucor saturninus]